MSVMYAWSTRNGTTQNAVSRTPSTPRVNPRSTAHGPSTRAPAHKRRRATKIRTMPCDHGERQHDGRPAAVLAGLEPAGEQAETEHRERQRDGERELARHRALHVAAVDREALVEQEAGARRARTARASGSGSGPDDRTPSSTSGSVTTPMTATILNATPYGKHDVEQHDHQRRHDHVEAVHREARRTSSCSSR